MKSAFLRRALLLSNPRWLLNKELGKGFHKTGHRASYCYVVVFDPVTLTKWNQWWNCSIGIGRQVCTIFAWCISYRGKLLQSKRGRVFLISRIGLHDKCHTLKSCTGVVLVGAVVAAMILIIRLVGEIRLQRFLDFLLFFKRRKPKLDLVSKALASENRIWIEYIKRLDGSWPPSITLLLP